MDCSPPGSLVLEISQARTLEWFPFPSPGDLPDPGFEPVSPALQANSLPLSHPGNPIDIYSILHLKKKSVTINQIVLSILIGLKQ